MEPTSRSNVSRLTPMFRRKTPGRDSSEGVPSSKSSFQTMVAKFGKCFSSSEKKDAPSIVIMYDSGYVSMMVCVMASGSGPVGRASVVMTGAYVVHVKPQTGADAAPRRHRQAVGLP